MGVAFDCELLGHGWGTDATRAAFSGAGTVAVWLAVERAAAQAQADVGVIPSEAAARIAQETRAAVDVERIGERARVSMHPVVAVVEDLAERCAEHGRWVHWGLTSQDVSDTGTALQMRDGLRAIIADARRARDAAYELAQRHRAVPMAGRTHGQHAVPITFGLKAASWTDELDRALARLERALREEVVAELGGAAGTVASLGADAEAVRVRFAELLELPLAPVPWHAARDRWRAIAYAVMEAGCAAERVGLEVMRLQATEVAELLERTEPEHVGSSTMPQKRNPSLAAHVAGTARLLRAASSALTGHADQASERDGVALVVESLAVPQTFLLGAACAQALAELLGGLEVDAERMRRNLDASRGGVMAEALMMGLAPALGRGAAKALVADAVRDAGARGVDLVEALAQAGATEHVGADELERMLDPETYLGRAIATAEALPAPQRRPPLTNQEQR